MAYPSNCVQIYLAEKTRLMNDIIYSTMSRTVVQSHTQMLFGSFSWLQHVMKFANIVKEVQLLHQSSTVKNTGFPVGRRRANQVNHYVISFSVLR